MISEHISLKEATSSPTATRLGIHNIPSSAVLSKMEKVANRCFEPVRNWYGKPIKINSFYRSQDLNKAVGGSGSSQHCLGEAMDIDADKDNKIIFEWILKNLEFSQVIWEFGDDNNPDWIHISYTESKPNKNEVLRAIKENGKTKYIKY